MSALRYAGVGAAVGGALAAVVGSVSQVFGLDGAVALAVVVFLLPVGLATIVGWLRPVREQDVAFDLDHALGLDERVLTALELVRSGEPESATSAGDSSALLRRLLADEQIADALERLGAARPGAVYPARVPRSWLATALAGVLIAILPWFIPWATFFGGTTPASQVAAANNAQAARLESLAQQLDSQNAALDPASRAQLAAQLRQAAGNLRRDATNSNQANQDLLQAERAAAATAPQTGEDAALTLARIADALNAEPSTQAVTQALDNQSSASAAAAMSQATQGVGQMTPQQRDALANALQSASDAARNSDTSASQQLQQAAAAVRRGDANGASQASQALQQLGAASQAQQDTAQVQSALQASRDAVNQATQASSDALNQSALSSDAANPGQSSSASDQTGSSNLASSSQDAQATQSGSPSPGDQSNAPGDQSAASDGSGVQTGSQSGQSASDSSGGAGSANGGQNGQQPGGGYGTGSTEHLGSPQDQSSLAQREVVVPNDPNAPITGISATNQTQVGAVTDSRVDYQTVLPQYRQQAVQGMETGAVPTDLRNVVKGYFDSLAAK